MTDPISVLSKQRIIQLSAQIEVALRGKKNTDVAIEILRRLKNRAAESMAALPFLNFDDPADIMKAKVLANEIRRYDEWIAWIREIVEEGIAFDKEITEKERDELVDILTRSPAGRQEAVKLGLIDPHTEGDDA